MNVQEAWGELGLEPPCSGEQIRRAYLRRLKSRNPEKDREGFLRLREAYELVLRLGSATEDVAAPPAEAQPAPIAEGPSPPATPAETEGESEAGGEAEGAEPVAPIEIDLDDPAPAARMLIEAFGRFREDPDRPMPPPTIGLRVFLALMERRQMKTAGELYASLHGIVEGMGPKRAFGPRASAWAVAESLWKQRHEIQKEPFITMAESIGALQPHRSTSALRAFARREPEEARWLYHHLDVNAPELFQLFGSALLRPPVTPSPAQPVPQARTGRSPTPWLGGVGVGVFMLFRLISFASRSDPPDYRSYPTPQSPAAQLNELSRAATEMANRGDCVGAVDERNNARELAGRLGERIPIDSRQDYERMEELVDARCSRTRSGATSAAAPRQPEP